MPTRALYIGRFQPFHQGHLDAVQQILSHPDGFDEIVIVIGSAENDFLPENPLTAGERCEMIGEALTEAGIDRSKIWILPIRNIDRYSLWPFHIARLCPEFCAVFSGSPLVRMLWAESFGNQKKIYPLLKNLTISATAIREKMARKEDLNGMVSPAVAQFLKDHRISERIEHLA